MKAGFDKVGWLLCIIIRGTMLVTMAGAAAAVVMKEATEAIEAVQQG